MSPLVIFGHSNFVAELLSIEAQPSEKPQSIVKFSEVEEGARTVGCLLKGRSKRVATARDAREVKVSAADSTRLCGVLLILSSAVNTKSSSPDGLQSHRLNGISIRVVF